ncbi:YnfU family zinc-binding protein [Providencia heimbachae]|uniref:YnfU family zinc-binding protein n=1 Tax=Providencia heimbachae TaxID=333962 RepID=UPI00223F8389|nr:YnfU family zinc-binding protein [Providencia heimbachae]
MSIFNGFTMFHDKSVEVTCPKCSRIMQQSLHRLKKNITMICPHCGYYFKNKEQH